MDNAVGMQVLHQHVSVQPGSFAAWMAAMRPRSLPVAVSPVLVGAAFAWARNETFHATLFVAVLAVSLLVQLVCNLQNDVGYTVRGGERGTRTGLPRATAQGWLSVRQVRGAIMVLALAAFAIGLLLVSVRGWPVLVVGVVSLAAAFFYMGGPKPIAYSPLGELTVLVFFGLVAVLGTEWVLAGSVGASTVVGAMAVGAIAAAALAVNNHRDVAHDREVGRRTFAALFGVAASRRLFAALLLMPYLLCFPLAWLERSPALLLPWVLAVRALRLKHDFDQCPTGTAFNHVLFRTFVMGLQFSLLLAAGVVLARFWGVR